MEVKSRRALHMIVIMMGIVLLLVSACGSSKEGVDANGMVEFSAKDANDMIEETGAEEWTYVTLGDSMNKTYPSILEEMMEEDLGIQISYKRRWIGGDHSSYLLQRLRDSESLRQDLHEADIITFDIPYNIFEKPCQFACGVSDEGCEGMTAEQCLAEAAETYMADTDAILAEIAMICDSSKTLIRTMDSYQFFIKESKDAGSFEMINKYWRECNEHLITEAAKYNIPVIRTYDAFMGESGDEDPRDSNLVYNGKNQTEEGAEIVAKLFHEVGYFYAPEK